MWTLLLLIVLFWWITRIQEGYTEITPSIIDLTSQINKKITIDQLKVSDLSGNIAHQTDQINQIDSIIATLRARNNNA